jgi:hypothetical protein
MPQFIFVYLGEYFLAALKRGRSISSAASSGWIHRVMQSSGRDDDHATAKPGWSCSTAVRR